MPKKTNYSVFFSTYLVQDVPEDSTSEETLDCPFHDCENPTNHFYANCSDGTWHCKRCDSSGNARTLITRIHDQYLHKTTQNQYKSLSEVRGLLPSTLEDAGFAYDSDHDRWLVPYYTYNPETNTWSDFLNNLGYFYPSSTNEKTRFTIKKGGALPLYLYNPGLHQFPPSTTTLLFEGEWDTLAYIESNPNSEDMLLGKPGAGFNLSFMQTLSRTKTLQIFLDNDDAGRKQTSATIRIANELIKDIYILDWTLIPNAPKDIRDLWMEHGTEMLPLLENAIVPYSEGEVIEEIVGSYQTNLSDYELIEDFHTYTDTLANYLYLTDETKLAMAATLGITNSISIPGEPLWAFLIGPPSSGKTTFIDSFGGNNEMFDNLSKISAKALVSGWKDETGEEPSYLAKLRNKTLFVKDFTVTLTDSPDSQREVFGLLTDIFDGYVKIPYGNNQVREFYNLYFNMIAGVTDIVHKHSAASIGERFLRIDYLGKDYNPREFARRALVNFGQAKNQKESLTKTTLGFVNHLRNLPIILSIEDEYIDPIIDLAEFIATIRTKVETDAKEGIRYRPRAELPARLAAQLGKQFVSTRSVYMIGEDTDENVSIASAASFEVVKKVALDTCYGFSLDLVKTILQNPLMDRQQIASKADIHPQRAYKVLADLETTGVITTCRGHRSSRGGRPANHYNVNPKIAAVLHYENKETPRRKGKKRPPRRT